MDASSADPAAARRLISLLAAAALLAALAGGACGAVESDPGAPGPPAAAAAGGGAGPASAPAVVAEADVAALAASPGALPAAGVPVRGALRPPPSATPPARRAELAPPPISAASAVVIDGASGTVLFEKDPHRRMPPASLTKLATAILAVDAGDLDAIVTSDVDSRTMRGSTVMGLVPGDQFSLRDLLYGLMLPSGNDAALAIGRVLAGSDERFVAQMNALAERLGLADTHFQNPHGLGGGAHYSSARDLALLARAYMAEPALAEVAAARRWTARGSREIEMWTLNALLATYPGADGVKTGYTRTAGRTFAASASRDGHRVFVVVLNAPAREDDARRLFDWVFAAYRWEET